METLRQVPGVGDSLAKGHTRIIRKLHKLIFGDEGDRKNRQRLREFPGFVFADNSNEFREKVEWVVQEFTLGDLTSICNVLRIEYDGTIESVAQRICRNLCDLNNLVPGNDEEEEEDSSGEDSSEEEQERVLGQEEGRVIPEQRNERVRERAVVEQRNERGPVETRRTPTFAMTYRDVEDTIRPFDGKSDYPVDIWITDFEENAQLFDWDDMQKLIFARKSLTGLAKSFVRSERGINSWRELKKRLTREFSRKINSAELHRNLWQRKMRREESVQEYYLAMKEIAARGNIEADALMQYVIDGIPDDTSHKSVLYGAENLHQFKTRLETYAKMRDKFTRSKDITKHAPRVDTEIKKTEKVEKTEKTEKTEGAKATTAGTSDSKKILRCYNCNGEGHRFSACDKPKRERGSCYTCGSTEHLQRACPQRPTTSSSTTTSSMNSGAHLIEEEKIVPCYELSIYLEVGKIIAMIDTGSPVSLLTEACLPREVTLTPCNDNFRFDGINGSRVKILGRLKQTGYVCDEKVTVNFYVVPNETMKGFCLLGRDFIVGNNLELLFNRAVTLRKDSPVDSTNCNFDVLRIDVCETNNDPEVNINANIDSGTQRMVRDVIDTHYVNAIRPEQPDVDLEMEIVVKPNHQTFHFHPRRLSYAEKEAVKVIIHDLLDRGIIRASTSPYCSPIVMVKKKTGDYRMAVDYRELNKITLRDNMPIPRIEDQLDELQGKKYFTRLDLKDAFHHITIKEDCVPFTSFVTSLGQYEYLKMPFGLKNGPAFFMRYIRRVFRELLDKNQILIYLDDILIATKTVEENLDILKELLAIMVRNHLELKYSKCEFLATEINYLGYRISERGIAVNSENIRAIAEYPMPRNFKELESYLGLISYFRKFVKDFALHAKPLYDLKKSKSEFAWTEDCLASYEYLKKTLVSEPVLSIYNAEAETQLHCDASAHGYGSVLMQKQGDGKFHPVCYFSRRTTDVESRYHSFELECLSIIYSLERFRIYLQGIAFTIVTDCNSLRLALEKKDINPRILRWSLILRDYDYQLEHRTADRMRHADALSRVYSTMVIDDNTFEDNLQILQGADQTIKQLREQLEKSEDKKFELNNGLVYRKDGKKLLFYVPESMEDNVIRTGHEQIGHQGINKSVEFISRSYWFPNLKEKVEVHIKNCLKCIAYSANANRKEGTLHCPDKGKTPFKCLHIDHYGPLESTAHKHKYVFEIIDAFTKFVKLYPVKSTGTDEVIKHLKTYFSNYSKPSRIVSDRGSAFTSTKFKDFLGENGIEQVLIATSTPHANGQIERINRMLTPMLGKLSKTSRAWSDALIDAEYAINNSINRAINTTPARLLFGVDQIGRVRDDLREILNDYVDTERDVDNLRDSAALQIEKCNNYNKQYYDKKRKPPTTYSEGDYVMIKNVDVSPGVNKKLIPPYKGPYVVKRVLDKDRYVISDPENYQHTQIPYEGVSSPENMRPWIQS